MGVIEIVILALGLSMDAFAVSVCRGLSLNKITFKDMFIAGIWFGGFQALMTAAGFFLGSTLSGLISDFDHWIAFILLCFLGLNMIKEGLEDGFGNGKEKETEVQKDSDRKSVLGVKTMFFLAVATSIDALATGITLAFLNVGILFPAFVIGGITFLLSAWGIKCGNVFGSRYQWKAELAGGIILILIGLKILLEHLGVFGA